MEVSVLRRCSSYRGVRFMEVSIKRELTVSVKKIYTTFYESCPDPRTPFSARASACVR